jgi:hypothetical protein
LARAAGTISYEILSSLGARLERVYVETERSATPADARAASTDRT